MIAMHPDSDRFDAASEATTMLVDLISAQDREELDNLYFEWIGSGIIQEEPEVLPDRIAALLHGWLREFCAAAGVDYDWISFYASDVGVEES